MSTWSWKYVLYGFHTGCMDFHTVVQTVRIFQKKKSQKLLSNGMQLSIKCCSYCTFYYPLCLDFRAHLFPEITPSACYNKFLLQNFYPTLSLLSPICSHEEWMQSHFYFPPFVSLNDFWATLRSNGSDSFKLRDENKCAFNSHFLFFNSPIK